METNYFKQCFGVFQGGGTRAAALSGAYTEAIDRGVTFSAVAGTSAGSIVAALVAAGATPQFLETELSELVFPKLLVRPERSGGFEGFWSAVIGWAIYPLGLFSKSIKMVSRILRYGGCYSSSALEIWVEERLKKLLPDVESPIKFKDLRRPVYIVASDMATKSAKVWSTVETPEDSVAFAVRASSSIPVFFQPAMVGKRMFVDGGMLSNLPAFVFDKDDSVASRRILAFLLESSATKDDKWTPFKLASELLDTVVSGATRLQVNMQRSVSCIEIDTGKVSAIDFDKMDKDAIDKLVASGKNAARKFFDSEVFNLNSVLTQERVLGNREDLNLAVVRESLPSKVVVAESNTKWYWDLFPTFFYWRSKGVPVYVLLQKISGDESERQKENSRRANLEGIGAFVQEVENLPLTGYVFSRKETLSSSAIIFSRESNHGPLAYLYKGSTHQQAISLMDVEFQKAWKEESVSDSFTPRLVADDPEAVCDAIQSGVSQYKGDHVNVSWGAVEIRNTRPITKLIKTYKYEQMIRLIELYKDASIPLFSAASVTLRDDGRSMMCPPVFEVHGGKYIGIEGNTRTYYAYLEGMSVVNAIVVTGLQGAHTQIQGTSVPVAECSLILGKYSPAERMPGFEYELFRRIEGACRPHR